MPQPEDLEIDAWISVRRRHPISCDVYDEEVQFKLGPHGSSLVLCFTWPALTKFLDVARTVAELSGKRPIPAMEPYEVDADELSRLAHHPGEIQLDGKQIVLHTTPTKKGK